MPTSPLDRRLQKLEKEWNRRQASYAQKLFEPQPPFSVRMSEQDVLRRYLADEQSGELFKMRESNGGYRPDKDVDAYAAAGERLKAKFAPAMLLNDTVGKAMIASGQQWTPVTDPPKEAPEDHPHVPLSVDQEFSA